MRGVVVHGLPETPSRVTVPKGGTLCIICVYVDQPPLPEDEQVSWYCKTDELTGYLSHQGHLLEGLNSWKYGIDDDSTTTTVTVRNMTERDSGRYVCKRSNHADANTDVVVVNGEF